MADEIHGFVHSVAVCPVLRVVLVVAGVDQQDVAGLDRDSGLTLPAFELLGPVDLVVADAHPLEVDDAGWADEPLPHANPNHIEMSIDQLLSFRPTPSLAGYRTPVSGLFLTGAGTHPGGGVTGAPGRNAAGVVLRDLGLASRRRSTQRLRERVAMIRDAARAARALGKAA
jgi:hypothetical protein